MSLSYRIECVRGFRDGNVYPRFVRPREVIVVDEATFHKMKQSDPLAFDYGGAIRTVPKHTTKQAPAPAPEPVVPEEEQEAGEDA